MADIKQAAKWMQRGKVVRRKAWPVLQVKASTGRESDSCEHGWSRGCVIDAVRPRVENPLDVGDLLAEDWEVVKYA